LTLNKTGEKRVLKVSRFFSFSKSVGNMRENRVGRIWVLLLILIFSFQLGVAVLPHTHGKDIDHSKHSNCPIFKLDNNFSGMCLAAVGVFFTAMFILFILLLEQDIFSGRSSKLSIARAPPLGTESRIGYLVHKLLEVCHVERFIREFRSVNFVIYSCNGSNSYAGYIG
jgi:hypothetical protein